MKYTYKDVKGFWPQATSRHFHYLLAGLKVAAHRHSPVLCIPAILLDPHSYLFSCRRRGGGGCCGGGLLFLLLLLLWLLLVTTYLFVRLNFLLWILFHQPISGGAVHRRATIAATGHHVGHPGHVASCHRTGIGITKNERVTDCHYVQNVC